MNKKELHNDNTSIDDKSLEDIINENYLTLDDIKWLKKKRWFKRFIKIYKRELSKRHLKKPVNNDKEDKNSDIEVLDIEPSNKEVIEILDFTKTMDITDVKDITNATDKAKKKIKIEKLVWSVVITICSIALLILLVILINWIIENKKTEDMVNTINDVAQLEEVTTTTTTTQSVLEVTTTPKNAMTDYEKYANMNMINVNFDNLKNINPDTVGWLYVPGTEINYPFVQTINNDYYLKHSFDKSSNKKGWVFLDFRNNIDNLSKNTVLYAHGLVNNQMFGSMRRTIKKGWYENKSNHIIKISTPSTYQYWQVFSVYTIKPESYYITTDFNTDDEYNNFLNELKKRSVYNFNVSLTTNDKILTLSSCYDDEKRMVLHAKLINIINK